mmetsp:Transcript_4173/g.5234  ORF Transcript_4173/g.5234 Transcript_4173/m.5234 type:complete len:83 (+) Transcript_4173:388-636(+)
MNFVRRKLGFAKKKSGESNNSGSDFSHSKYEFSNSNNKEESRNFHRKKAPGSARIDSFLRDYSVYRKNGSGPLVDRNGKALG